MSQNALVRLIYEAIDDPLVWSPFLTKFTEVVHSEAAGLCTEDKAGHWGRNLATVGMDSASRKSYEEYFFFVIRGSRGVRCLLEMSKRESNSLTTANW